MITFNSIDVSISLSQLAIKSWLLEVTKSENKVIGHINYVFCNDSYLLDINQRFLDHDTYTDIITFDNSNANFISADIYISIDRVNENAVINEVAVAAELLRVIVHGVLHLCGYKDKSNSEALLMRSKEEEKINMFHVER